MIEALNACPITHNPKDVRLSEHFILDEFLVSDTAPKIAAAMRPTPYQLIQLTRVANLILEPTRLFIAQLAGKEVPLKLTSGLRTYLLIEALIKAGYPASRTSQHCYGEAADFVPPVPSHRDLRDIFIWIAKNLPYRQLILYEGPDERPKGNLHVSIAPLDNRYVKHSFMVDREDGRGGHLYLPASHITGRAISPKEAA